MANRYWVGGTASWDNTAGTKWASTSGGVGGETVPTAADAVFFDSASGTVTVSISSVQVNALSLNFTGFTGTLAGAFDIYVYGNITISSSMTLTHTGRLALTAAGTLLTSGKTITSSLVFNAGTGNTASLGDALTTSSSITVVGGTFATNNYSVSAPSIISNSGTRTISFGSSTITLSASNPFTLAATSTLTVVPGTSQVNLTSASVNFSSGAFDTSGFSFYNLSLTSTIASFITITGKFTYNNLTLTGPTAIGTTTISFNGDQIINGILSTTNTAGNRRLVIRSGTYGANFKLTINSAPSITDITFRDIVVVGTASPISGTRIGNAGGCSGITFSTPKTVTLGTFSSASWSANIWTAPGIGLSTDNFPLPQDTAIIDNSTLSAGTTITLDTSITDYPTIDTFLRTNTVTLSISSNLSFYGNIITGSGVTYSGNAPKFAARNTTQTITTNGKSLPGIIIDCIGGIVELGSSLTSTATINVLSGTFDTKNFAISGTNFSLQTTAQIRTVKLGSSSVALTNPLFSTVITASNNVGLNFDAGTSTITCTTSTAISLNSVLKFNNIIINFTNISTLILNSLIVNNLTLNMPSTGVGIMDSVTLPSRPVTIIGALTVTQTSETRRLHFRSDTLGTTAIISAGTISAPNCNFSDISLIGTASGASPIGAGNMGGNSGIVFPSSKTVYFVGTGTPMWTDTVWSTTPGGTASASNFPLPQDSVVFDNAATATAITVSTGLWTITNFNASARTNSLIYTHNASVHLNVLGNWTNGTGMTISSTTAVLYFIARTGTQIITSSGVTFGCSIAVQPYGTTTSAVVLGDAITTLPTRGITVTRGIFDAAIYSVNVGLLQFGGGTLKMGTADWFLSGTGTVWSAGSSSLNFYKQTANIFLSDNSTTARTFSGAGLTYNKLNIGGASSTSTTTITGNNQFSEITSTKLVAHTIALGTTTQKFGKWSISGTLGNIVTITGTSTSHIIAGSVTSGIDYLAMGSVGFSTSSMGEFYAGNNSTGTASAPVYRTAPPVGSDRYWVGGTGNWSDTTKWSTISGGVGGASIPTSLDNVIFNAASNATAYTITVDIPARCKQLTLGGPASGSMTFTGSNPINCHDNFTISSGVSWSLTGSVILTGSTTGKIINTNGLYLGTSIIVDGVGCGWTGSSALSFGWSFGQGFTLTNGSFNTAGYSLSTGAILSNNNNIRSLSLGSSTVSLYQATSIDFGTLPVQSADLTFNAGTSYIYHTVYYGEIAGNGKTFYNFSLGNNSAGGLGISGSNTFNNLVVPASAAVTGIKNIGFGADQIINGTLSISPYQGNCRISIYSSPQQAGGNGIQRTLTCASATLGDVHFSDIKIAGAAAPASGTRLSQGPRCSGIVFSAPKTVYWSNPTGGSWTDNAWAITPGGITSTDNYPLAQDTAVISDTGLNSGAIITYGTSAPAPTINLSTRTLPMTLSQSSPYNIVYGSFYSSPAVTFTSSYGGIQFSGNGTQYLKSNGSTIPLVVNIYSPYTTVVLQDAANITGTILLNDGILDTNGYNLSTNIFYSWNATRYSKLLLNNSNLTVGINNTSDLVWQWQYATLSNFEGVGNSTITVAAGVAQRFEGGGFKYSNTTLNVAGSGTVTVNGNNSFYSISNSYSNTGSATIIFVPGNFTSISTFSKPLSSPGNILNLFGPTASYGKIYYTGTGIGLSDDYLNISNLLILPLSNTYYIGKNSSVNNLNYGFVSDNPPGLPQNTQFFNI